MILRIHYNFDLKGGAEFDILKLLDVFDKYGDESWKNYLLLLTREKKVIKSKLHGNDEINYHSSEQELIKYLREIILELKIKLVHIHSQPYKNLTKIILGLGLPTYRSMHEAMIICPGWSKYWLIEDKPCQISFGPKCVINAYTKKCTRSRNPINLMEAYQNVRFETNIAVEKYKAVFVYSDFMKNEAIATGIPENKIVRIPSPQYDYFSDIEKTFNDNIIIAFSGRLSQQKGVKFLIEAVSLLIKANYKNIEVLIFGEGPDEDRLKKMAKDLKLNHKITFFGWVDRKLIIEYYKKAHILVVPSTYPDNFPNTVAESMLAKLAVIAFDSGGTCEWFKDGESGIKTTSKDAKGIFLEIKKLIDNEDLIKNTGNTARKLILKEHSLENTFNAYTKHYKKAINFAKTK